MNVSSALWGLLLFCLYVRLGRRRQRTLFGRGPLWFLRGEPALGLKRSHASETGGRDRLTEYVVGDVAGGEYTLYAGRCRAGRRLNVTVGLQCHLPSHEVGCWLMTDGDEDTVDQKIVKRASHDIP